MAVETSAEPRRLIVVPNILLTTRCARKCPYRFASTYMAHPHANDLLSWENAIYLADLLSASGVRTFLGGEPTLHPEFADLLLDDVHRGFNVTVFTSGVMSAVTLDQLTTHVARFSTERIMFVCNVNDPEQTETTTSELQRQHAFLCQLGPWTMPGSPHHPNFDLQFLFDLIERHRMRKTPDLGLAHPLPGASNQFIRVEEIGCVIQRICSGQGLV